MITLYDAPRCPYCARVRIVLAEKDVPHETVTIDLADRPAWLVERNPPHGRVPVLEEDGWVLPESVAIDEYLEERYPEPALLPADPGERAAVQGARRAVRRPRQAVLRTSAWGGRRRGACCRRRSQGLDAFLATMPFLSGRAFGLADVAYLPWLFRLRDLMGFSLASGTTAIGRWLEHVQRATVDRCRAGDRRLARVTDVTTGELAGDWRSPGSSCSTSDGPDEFSGEVVAPCDPRPGRIPGARNVDVTTLLEASDAESVHGSSAHAPGAEVIAYCHSGSRSALAVQLLAAAGYAARNYVGSWHEWSRDPALPAETG